MINTLAHVYRNGCETPRTISPKDSVFEFNESEADGVFPQFPQDSSGFEIDPLSMVVPSLEHAGHDTGPNIGSLHSNDEFGYLPSQMPPDGIQVPQQYPVIAGPTSSDDDTSWPTSSVVSSVVSGMSGGNTPAARTRLTGSGAEGGIYTCTYQRCTQRFRTLALLQKHKREGHQRTQGLGLLWVQEAGTMSGSLTTQAGRHRCDQINPSTKKPCNAVFSRPYDLTRHEDTIHNPHKPTLRCNFCIEERTFSRDDALRRHYRIFHPDNNPFLI